MKKLSFLQNTIVLVISNLVTGSLMFLSSIILSREIGAHGMGLYSMVMPAYSLFICLTCGGTTTAISKIVADRNSCNNKKELYKTITASIAFFSFWTIFISILVAALAPFISSSILKDSRTYLPILVFIPALVFVTIGSILKGYFYGLQNSTFPAIIDIVEKCVRILVLTTIVANLKDYGLKYQVTGAVAAMTAGELCSTLLLYIFYKRSYLREKQPPGKHDNVFQIIVNILKVSLPLCINGLIGTGLGATLAAMAPRRLQDAGFAPETSLALFGKVGGMAMNIVMFPAIIIGAISIILVPVISEASSTNSISMVNRKILSTIKLTIVVAAVSAGLLYSLSHELGRLFYSRNDLGNIIFSLSFGVIFIYLESTLFGILNGLGRQVVLLRNTIIMAILDVVLLYILLGIPYVNIYGYAVDFVLSPLLGCFLNYREIKKITGIEINISGMLLLPISAAVFEIIAVNSLKAPTLNLIKPQNLASFLLILQGAAIYMTAYFILKKLFL